MDIKAFLQKKYIFIHQRCYGKNRIKYIYEKVKHSNCLIVVFSGFSSKGQYAKYNYLRTLKQIDACKLFVLDDFGYKNLGGYYLTERQGVSQSIQDELVYLINNFKQDKVLITAGSSKGGTAALIYGMRCNAECIIAGAPQYYIGKYLNEPNHLLIYNDICKNSKYKNQLELDGIVENIINSYEGNAEFYIHCSPKEHTFDDHVIHLVSTLKKRQKKVITDFDYQYTSHAELAKYFPTFLFSVVSDFVKKIK